MCYVSALKILWSNGKVSFYLVFSRQAWQKLGAMPPEEAMQKYIDIVTELYPTWAAGSSLVRF